MTKRSRGLSALASLLLAGCAANIVTASEMPSTPVSSPAELQARTDAFSRAIVEASAAGWSTESVARLAAFYTQDTVVFPPRGEPIRGEAAITAYWTRPAGRRILAHSVTAERIDVSGDLATEYGRFTIRSQVDDGAPVEGAATYVSIWRRVGGVWRKQMDTWW